MADIKFKMSDLKDYEIIEVLNTALIYGRKEYFKNDQFKKQTDLIGEAIGEATQTIINEQGSYKVNALILASFEAIKTALNTLMKIQEKSND